MHHVRHAIRLLFRETAFSLTVILTLALGVGANIAVFAVVEAVLLRPLPYADAGELVILEHRDRRTGITKAFIAIGDYVDLASRQAATRDILWIVIRQGVVIAAAGMGIGVAAAYFATRSLDGVLFGVTAAIHRRSLPRPRCSARPPSSPATSPPAAPRASIRPER